MTTTPFPLLQSEETLAQLYAERLEQLALDTNDPNTLANIQSLQNDLQNGFNDLIVDQIEILAARIDRAQDDDFDYLLDTDTGLELQRQTLNQLRNAEDIVRNLSENLSNQDNPEDRLDVARALHTALHDHRDAYNAALRNVGEDTETATAPGSLLLDSLTQSLRLDVANAAQTPQRDAQTPQPTGLRSIDLGLLLQRANAQPRDAQTPPLALTFAQDPQPQLPPNLANDPALYELLRTRVNSALPLQTPSTPQLDTPKVDLRELDRELAQAAQNYGAALALRTVANELDEPSVQIAPRVLELAQQRVLANDQALASLPQDAPEATRRALQAQTERAERERAALQERLDSQNTVHTQDLQNLVQSIQDDMKVASSLNPDLRTSLTQSLTQTLDATNALSGQSLANIQTQSAQNTQDQLSATQETAESATRLEDLTRNLPATPTVDLNEEAQRGASERGQQRAQNLLTQRLMRRSSLDTYSSSLPNFAVSRVFATDDSTDLEAIPTAADDNELRSFAASAGDLAGSDVIQRLQPLLSSANSGAGLSNIVDLRNALRSQPLNPDLRAFSQMGTEVARSVSSLSGLFQTGMRSAAPRPTPIPQRTNAEAIAEFAPRMAASMPSNIFANTSSPVMQNFYMPALARVAGMPGAGVAGPRALAKEADDGQLEALSATDLYDSILGDLGDFLQDSQPELSSVISERLTKISDAMGRGDGSLDMVRDYAKRLRSSLGDYMGADLSDPSLDLASKGTNFTRDLPSNDPIGMLAKDMDLSVEGVESSLRGERQSISSNILSRMEKIFGKPLTDVEAFSGPTAGKIARDMGAEAFTVGSKMFFPEGSLDFENPRSGGIFAHELYHAIKNDPDPSKTAIAQEEREAYSFQHLTEASRSSNLTSAMSRAASQMNYAKSLPSGGPASFAAAPGSGGVVQARMDGSQKEEERSDDIHITTKAGTEIPYEELKEAVEQLWAHDMQCLMERHGRGSDVH